MKLFITTIVTIFILFFLSFYAGFILGEKESKTDLEIYTQTDIIYIKDLTVTKECCSDTIVFKNNKDLKEYISTLTSK